MRLVFFILMVLFINLPMASAKEGSADASEDAKKVFESRCSGMCHQLPDPAMLKAKQWRKIMTVMQQRMEQKGISPLDEAEFETIFNYLKERAR